MTDSFLATVVSYDKAKNEATVSPLIVETDGTDHPDIITKPVAGITPEAKDVVLVVTARNNLDDKTISRFFEASETNGRIVHVVKPQNGVYIFTGDYKFVGDVKVDGKLEVTGDVTLDSNLEVKGDTKLDGDLHVVGDSTMDGKLDVTGAVNLHSTCHIAGKATLDADLEVQGNTTMHGTATFSSGLMVTGTVKLQGIAWSTHTHSYVGLLGPAMTGPPV